MKYWKQFKIMGKTLRLIHPVHGVVRTWTFQFQFRRYDTKGVLKIVDRWRKMYGKSFLQCTTEWD